VPAFADQAAAQLSIDQELRESVDAAYAAGLAEFDEATRNGSLLRGEVLARWQDFAGTGELLRTLQARRGRGQSGRPKKQRSPARLIALKAALRASLESLVIATADRAAEHAAAAWQENPAGAVLLADPAPAGNDPSSAGGGTQSEPDFVASALADLGIVDGSDAAASAGPAGLRGASAGLPGLAAAAIAGWQNHVLHVVQEENVTKRSIARVVSFDHESLALVLAIGVLGYGEPGVPVPDGVSAAPQQLLTSLFGAGLLRDIGVRIRLDLHDRISAIMDIESGRFEALLDAAGGPAKAAPAELLQAGFTLESAR